MLEADPTPSPNPSPLVRKPQTRAGLDVPLNDEEVASKSAALVADMTELDRLEVEFAALKKERASEIKDLKASINRTRRIVASRVEARTVTDAVEVFDVPAKRAWLEYRGNRFKERHMTPLEIQTHVNQPLFPEHDAAAERGDSDDVDDAEGVNVEPFPPNVSDIEQARREDQGRLRKDHTARA